MPDVIYVLLTLAVFAALALLVGALDRFLDDGERRPASAPAERDAGPAQPDETRQGTR